ncbi:MAG: serine/threonine protein kinase [Gemmataceae bacterium]|nr:serine/threonine protein kinase [Gemmataceae bacterium]
MLVLVSVEAGMEETARQEGPGTDARLADVPELGRHDILCEIGRGGMGIVHKAREIALDRIVALKTLRGRLPSPADRERFHREARALAALRHPGIVPVFALGTLDGEDCFTMPYYPDGTLADRLRRGPLAADEAAALIAQVARAVQHAHGHGLIHRDLKPANILLDADGTPAVADFGLSRAVGDAARARGPVGTPAYMAPEQAVDGAAIGAGADVWALGVMLHEALAGVRPFQGAETAALVRSIRAEAPAALDDAPSGLETVVRRCLEKRPEDRYPSAGAVADAVEGWLERKRRSPFVRLLALLGGWSWRRAAAASLLACLAVPLMLAVSLLGATPAWSPEAAALKAIQEGLAKGRPQLLLGSTGAPLLQRFPFEPDRKPVPPLPARPFQLATFRRTQLELLPSVPLKRFRLSGEFRLVDGNGAARAGFYVAGLETAAVGRDEFDFFSARIGFGEQPGTVEAEAGFVHFKGFDAKGATHFSTANRGLVPPAALGAAALVGAGPRGIPAAPNAVALAAPRADPWHRIEVEVDEKEVACWFDGVLACRASIRDADVLGSFWWKRNHPDGHPLHKAKTGLKRTGRLGVYLSSGASDIRNVVLTPLP